MICCSTLSAWQSSFYHNYRVVSEDVLQLALELQAVDVVQELVERHDAGLCPEPLLVE